MLIPYDHFSPGLWRSGAVAAAAANWQVSPGNLFKAASRAPK